MAKYKHKSFSWKYTVKTKQLDHGLSCWVKSNVLIVWCTIVHDHLCLLFHVSVRVRLTVCFTAIILAISFDLLKRTSCDVTSGIKLHNPSHYFSEYEFSCFALFHVSTRILTWALTKLSLFTLLHLKVGVGCHNPIIYFIFQENFLFGQIYLI